MNIEPRPRNPLLADAMKRIGIVERSGRGVDTIYRGLLRYGRAAPDYSRTDSGNVVLRMPTNPANMDFIKLVIEEEERCGSSLPIDSLIALSAVRELRRLTLEELAERIQRDTTSAKRTLEVLTEAGLVEAHGTTRGRSYTLSATLYREAVGKAAYIRQAGFSAIQREQMILSYVRQHGKISRSDVMELCHISKDQASKLLVRLSAAGKIVMHGIRRGAFYSFPEV